MAENLKVTLPGGYTLALENVDAAGVSDITQNAGENVLQAEADAQKPVTQEGAEYDAAAEADKGKEIENVQQVASQESESAIVAELARENGNTFYGMHIMNAAKKSGEAFGITKAFSKMRFNSIKEAIATDEIKAAIEVAKKWAAKKGYHLATPAEVNNNKTTLLEWFRTGAMHQGNDSSNLNSAAKSADGKPVFKEFKWVIHTVNGAAIIGFPFGGRVELYIMFAKDKNGKVFSKKLAVYRERKDYAVESYGVFAGLFAREAAEADAGEANPAATDNPVTPEEADPETETVDVNVSEDIDEPAPAATEPAAPAAEPATATETPAATEPAPAATEPAAPAATEDDDAKAVESFYQDFFKDWNK